MLSLLLPSCHIYMLLPCHTFPTYIRCFSFAAIYIAARAIFAIIILLLLLLLPLLLLLRHCHTCCHTTYVILPDNTTGFFATYCHMLYYRSWPLLLHILCFSLLLLLPHTPLRHAAAIIILAVTIINIITLLPYTIHIHAMPYMPYCCLHIAFHMPYYYHICCTYIYILMVY